MSRKDTSLERVDIVKLLVFILLFVLVCLAMIFGFILPNIKEYRALNAQHRSQAASHAKVAQIYADKSAAFEALKQKNAAVLTAYDTGFNKQNFQNFVSKFFSEVSLEEVEPKKPDENFFRYQLNVSVVVKSPQDFYDFLDALSKYENVVKAEFPITMKSENDKINMSFGVRIYGAK